MPSVREFHAALNRAHRVLTALRRLQTYRVRDLTPAQRRERARDIASFTRAARSELFGHDWSEVIDTAPAPTKALFVETMELVREAHVEPWRAVPYSEAKS